MKRSMKTALLLLSFTHITASPLTRLPDNFYILDANGQTNMMDTSTSPRAFFIIVATTSTSPLTDSTAYQTVTSLISTATLDIPTGFTPQLPPTGKTISLYFNWEDQVGFKNIRDYGKIFAKGINNLISTYSVPCIIVSFNRAGLLVNYASQLWATPSIEPDPLPTLIQIGTPVPTPSKNYSDFLPNPKGISQLFFFYSKQPFVVDQPTLHPAYQPTYTPIQGLSVYNILVILNNKQPLQHEIASILLAQNLITCCSSAQTNYTVNKNLFLNLSTLKPYTNGVIGISKPMAKKQTMQGAQELLISKSIVQNLQESLGRDLALDISKGEYLRNTHRQQ